MEEQNWEEELNQMCREDDRYQLGLASVEGWEAAYEQTRALLGEEQREILDQYVIACEELDHARQILAYQLGRIHGKEELRRK